MDTPPPPLSEIIVGCGSRLDTARLVLGFRTQTKFAAYLGVGVGRLNQWIHDKYPPDLHAMAKLKREGGISLDWIYMNDPSGLSWQTLQTIMSLGAQADAPAAAVALREHLGRQSPEPAPRLGLHEATLPPGMREDQAPTPEATAPRRGPGRPRRHPA